MFYLIKKNYRAQNKNEKLVIFLINCTQKDLISLLKTKICTQKILDDKKIFSIKNILAHKKIYNQKKVIFLSFFC